jgi:hypothetical protein
MSFHVALGAEKPKRFSIDGTINSFSATPQKKAHNVPKSNYH